MFSLPADSTLLSLCGCCSTSKQNERNTILIQLYIMGQVAKARKLRSKSEWVSLPTIFFSSKNLNASIHKSQKMVFLSFGVLY